MIFKLSSELVDAAEGNGDAIRTKEETLLLIQALTEDMVSDSEVGSPTLCVDDYDIIHGLNFLRKTKIVLMSYLNGVMIANERCPCFVPYYNVTT
ncbi:hypothetical protein SADUNF_Sadunf19G0065300 [Salix dunnii]|uniref:Uncharacterized protein n=1 Tax=Salix dunnii TaxID=1413687 RepID=A0A835J5U8_9ROSI|nr:hypothetical protein SADUNF_Sadunf19G0065300 [Salix dunnii]